MNQSQMTETVAMGLRGENLWGGYGGVDILRGCSICANPGEISVIVGPNGAGKSTVMKALLGLLPLREGSVSYNGVDIISLAPTARAGMGIAFVPQTENVFPSMTVQENLEMGAWLREDDFGDTLTEVYDLFPALKDKRTAEVGSLSGGQRQQVAIARALMIKPTALLLDEPTAGVSPIVIDELFHCITNIKTLGVCVLMVEQNAKQALQICDKGYVLVMGENCYTDTGAALLADEDVRRTFLGG